MTHRLQEACAKNEENEDDSFSLFIREGCDHAIWNMTICAFLMTFGACLNTDLQKNFEEKFNKNYKAKFMGIKPNYFESFYDVEKLSWEVV